MCFSYWSVYDVHGQLSWMIDWSVTSLCCTWMRAELPFIAALLLNGEIARLEQSFHNEQLRNKYFNDIIWELSGIYFSHCYFIRRLQYNTIQYNTIHCYWFKEPRYASSKAARRWCRNCLIYLFIYLFQNNKLQERVYNMFYNMFDADTGQTATSVTKCYRTRLKTNLNSRVPLQYPLASDVAFGASPWHCSQTSNCTIRYVVWNISTKIRS